MKHIILFFGFFLAYYTPNAMEEHNKSDHGLHFNHAVKNWTFKRRKALALESLSELLGKNWSTVALQEKDRHLKLVYEEANWAIHCLQKFQSDHDIIVYLNTNNFMGQCTGDPVECYLRYSLLKINKMSILKKYLSETPDIKATSFCVKDRERMDRLWDIEPKTWGHQSGPLKIQSKL